MTRYELLDRIGVGGMAEIFRGKAIAGDGFETPVAIKRILPQLSQDPQFVELLIAEAKVLSLLKHRNIVQIFDVGLGDDGQYFLVMEYVDGKDLGAIQTGLEATRTRMPLDLVLTIGAEICDALEHAHSVRGPDGLPMALVHRDVSPTNVMVSRTGEIKLTDFGIAKRAEEATGHGAVRGKFAYISPEQARNDHLTACSDVFAVGLLLWELATNRRLFSRLPDLDALRAVREAKVPLPSSVDARLPAGIDPLLMTALAPDPANRYASAEQFSAKLRALRNSLDVVTEDPGAELGALVDMARRAELERDRAPALRVSVSRIAAPELARPGGRRRAAHDTERVDATMIRIQTADAFSLRDLDGTGLVKARAVIDRFDEQETRVAIRPAEPVRSGRVRGDTATMITHSPQAPAQPDDDRTMTTAPVEPTPEPSNSGTPIFDAADTLNSRSGPPAPERAAPAPAPTTPLGRPSTLPPPQAPLGRPSTLPPPQAPLGRPSTLPPPQAPLGRPSTLPPPQAPLGRPSTLPPPQAPLPPAPPRQTQPPPWHSATPLPLPQQPWHGSTPPPQPQWHTPTPPQLPPWHGSTPQPPWHDTTPPPPHPAQGYPGGWAVPGGQPPPQPVAAHRQSGPQLWMLVVGAVVVAVIAFVITRIAISH